MVNKKDVTTGAWAWLLAMLSMSWSMGALASCGAAFCTVNTNWNLSGLAAEPGLRLNLHYEYINQDRPMAGGDRVGIGQIPRHHDEAKTVNRNYVGTLDYTVNEKWGIAGDRAGV